MIYSVNISLHYLQTSPLSIDTLCHSATQSAKTSHTLLLM
jgi:hypothetical protein